MLGQMQLRSGSFARSICRYAPFLTTGTRIWLDTNEYQREEQKRPLVKVNDMLDPLPEDQALKPIEEIVRGYCEKYPNVIIQDYFEDGYLSPRHQNPGPGVGDTQSWVQYLHDPVN